MAANAHSHQRKKWRNFDLLVPSVWPPATYSRTFSSENSGIVQGTHCYLHVTVSPIGDILESIVNKHWTLSETSPLPFLLLTAQGTRIVQDGDILLIPPASSGMNILQVWWQWQRGKFDPLWEISASSPAESAKKGTNDTLFLHLCLFSSAFKNWSFPGSWWM